MNNDELAAWALGKIAGLERDLEGARDEVAGWVLSDAAADNDIHALNCDVERWRDRAERAEHERDELKAQIDLATPGADKERAWWEGHNTPSRVGLTNPYSPGPTPYAPDDHQDAEVTQWTTERLTLADLENAPVGSTLGPDEENSVATKRLNGLWSWAMAHGVFGSERFTFSFVGDWTRATLTLPTEAVS